MKFETKPNDDGEGNSNETPRFSLSHLNIKINNGNEGGVDSQDNEVLLKTVYDLVRKVEERIGQIVDSELLWDVSLNPKDIKRREENILKIKEESGSEAQIKYDELLEKYKDRLDSDFVTLSWPEKAKKLSEFLVAEKIKESEDRFASVAQLYVILKRKQEPSSDQNKKYYSNINIFVDHIIVKYKGSMTIESLADDIVKELNS